MAKYRMRQRRVVDLIVVDDREGDFQGREQALSNW
jgi:hypothetical protein